MLALLVVAVAEARAPGQVVADVRGQIGTGTSYPFGPIEVGAVEPELLILSPSGRGFGVGLIFGVVGGANNGSTLVAGIGPKYAVVSRVGQSQFCSKFGAELLALYGSPDNLGAKAAIEYGIVPLVAGRAAFPVEALLSGQFRAGAGLAATLGLSVGVGWIFGSEPQNGER